jgi:hypothetical protein
MPPHADPAYDYEAGGLVRPSTRPTLNLLLPFVLLLLLLLLLLVVLLP